MSDSLTREQVEQFKALATLDRQIVNLGYEGGGWTGIDSALSMMIDTDAALRQQLTELRTELASHAWTVTPTMVQAKLDQLARLTLHWTTERPTQAGWYWWRTEHRQPRIVWWSLPVEDLNMNHPSSEFAGPLVPPEEEPIKLWL